MLGAIAGIITAIASGAAAVGAGSLMKRDKESDETRKHATSEAEKLATSGDWSGLEAGAPYYEKAGVKPDYYQHLLQRGKVEAARQFQTQGHDVATQAGYLPPPEYMAALQRSQGGQQASPAPAQQPASPDEFANVRGQINQIDAVPVAQRGPLMNKRQELVNSETSMQPRATPQGAVSGAVEAVDGQPVSAMPTQPQGAPGPDFVFPRETKSISRSITGPLGTVTASTPAVDGKKITADLISQARMKNLPPEQLRGAIDAENLRRQQAGEPPLESDTTAIGHYADERFNTIQSQVNDMLTARGVPPPQAMVQAAQQAYSITGHIPQQWMSTLQPKEGELATAAYGQAVKSVDSFLSRTLAQVGEAKSPQAMQGAITPGFASRAIDGIPNLRPEDSIRAKHEVAQSLAMRLRPIVEQNFPGRTPAQYSALSMQLASYSTDGEVPKEWFPVVASNPEAFGFSKAQAEVMATNKINPFDADAGVRAKDAITQQEMQVAAGKETLQHPEKADVIEAARKSMEPKSQQAPTRTDVAAMARTRDLAIKGDTETQQRDIEHKFKLAPEKQIDESRAVDEIYTTSMSVIHQLQRKDANGQSMLDKYGDTPSFIFGPMQAIKEKFGTVPPDLQRLRDTVGRVFNSEKKEITGTASAARERSDLTTYMADAGSNLRTMLAKYTDLARVTGGETQRRLEFMEKNYPKTDTTSYGYRKIQAEKAKRAQAKEGAK